MSLRGYRCDLMKFTEVLDSVLSLFKGSLDLSWRVEVISEGFIWFRW